MGLIATNTEREQFVQGLRLAREVGWQDAKIAQELRVSNGDLRNMLSRHKPPSPKHIVRLNELMKSEPPRRIPPPPPSRPVVTPPKFNAAEASTIATTTDNKEAPSSTPPKEKVDMTTTEAVNGKSNGAATNGAIDNTRYQLLLPKEAKALRKAMNDILDVNYGGQLDKMATALQLTPNGLRKALTNNEGSISKRTKRLFVELTGWSDEKPPLTKVPKAPKTRGFRTGPTSKRGPNANHARVPKAEADAFRVKLAAEAKRAGGLTIVARAMGVNRGTLAFVLDGKGTSRDTVERFQLYLERNAPRDNRPDRTVTSTVITGKRPIADEAAEFDLYAIAGRLLANGRPAQAHLLSLIARVSETVPMEKITLILGTLVPYAATG